MVGRHQETADDAYVSGNVVSVMSQVSGRVEKVLVRDHQYVKAGERLIVIDPTDAKLALDAALSSLGITVREMAQLTHRLAEVQARIRSERLNLKQKKDDYERRHALFANRAVSSEEYLHNPAFVNTFYREFVDGVLAFGAQTLIDPSDRDIPETLREHPELLFAGLVQGLLWQGVFADSCALDLQAHWQAHLDLLLGKDER